MLAGDLPYQGEAQAGAHSAVAAAGAIEGRENSLAVGRRNARSVIGDQHCRLTIGAAHLDHDRRHAVLLGVVEQVAHHPLQQPAIAAHHHRLAGDGAMLVARSLLGGKGEQIDILAADPAACTASSRLESRICSIEAVELGDILLQVRLALGVLALPASSSMPSRMRDNGVRNSCEVLASSILCAPTSSSMRAAARLKLAASRATSSLPSTLTRAPRSPAPSEFHARLQPLEPARQPAHQRVGADRNQDSAMAARKTTMPNTGRRWRGGGRATTQRPSGMRMAQAGPPRP